MRRHGVLAGFHEACCCVYAGAVSPPLSLFPFFHSFLTPSLPRLPIARLGQSTNFGNSFPIELADRSWDNVGLLLDNVEVPGQEPTKPKVLLTNDLTYPVAEEAIARGASVVVSYRTFPLLPPSPAPGPALSALPQHCPRYSGAPNANKPQTQSSSAPLRPSLAPTPNKRPSSASPAPASPSTAPTPPLTPAPAA